MPVCELMGSACNVCNEERRVFLVLELMSWGSVSTCNVSVSLDVNICIYIYIAASEAPEDDDEKRITYIHAYVCVCVYVWPESRHVCVTYIHA